MRIPRTIDLAFARFQSRGEPKALAIVFDRTAPELHRLARHLAPRPEDAADLVQATFLAAIEARDTFRRGQPVLPWLTGILANRAREARRAAARRLDPERVRTETVADVDRELAAAEVRQQLDVAIDRMPEAYRPVLRLWLEHGLDAAEIARTLERPPGTVRAQISRGLAKLRALLPRGMATVALAAIAADTGLAAVRRRVLESCPASIPRLGSTLILGALVLFDHKVPVAVAALVLALVSWLVGTETRESAPVERAVLDRVATIDGGESSPRSEELPGRMVLPEVTGSGESTRTGDSSESAAPSGSIRITARWHDGRPAQIPVHLGHERAFLATRRSVRTDERGHCLVTGLRPGYWQLRRDLYTETSAPVAADSVTDVMLRIPPGAIAAGQVRRHDGRPAAGARVAWIGDEGEGGAVTCDALGRFELTGIECNYHLCASLDGAATESRYQSMLNPGERREFDLALGPPPGAVPPALLGRVRVEVSLADGVPPGTTRVVGYLSPRGLEGEPLLPLGELTGGGRIAGFACFAGLAPGRLALVLSHPGCAPTVQETVIEPGREALVDCVLRAGGRITGRVCDSAGAAVSCAQVEWGAPGARRGAATTTDHRGVFRIAALPAGRVALRILSAEGVADTEVDVVPGREVRWDPVLDRGLCIAGRIEDERGAPLVGWLVEGNEAEGRIGPVRTDSGGRFTLLRCRPDARYEVRVSDPVASSQSVPRARLPAVPAGSTDVVIRVEDASRPSGFLEGRILTPEGGPPGAAKVWVHEADGDYNWNFVYPVSALDGCFSIGPLPPGTYRLHTVYFHDCVHPRLDLGTHRIPVAGRVQVGQHRLRRRCALAIDLERNGIDGPMQGEILDAVTLEAVVTLRFAPKSLHPYGALGAGSYLLSVLGPGVEPVCVPFQLRDEAPCRLTVELRRAPGLTIGLQGLPDQECLLEVRDAKGGRVAVATRYRSVSEWSLGLRPGSYRVRARVGDRVLAETGFAMPAGGLRVELR